MVLLVLSFFNMNYFSYWKYVLYVIEVLELFWHFLLSFTIKAIHWKRSKSEYKASMYNKGVQLNTTRLCITKEYNWIQSVYV